MQWTKRGRIFEPTRHAGWFRSHAALPVVEDRVDHVRVYFSGRDDKGRARIGFFDVDPEHPERILDVAAAPCLDLGALGTFDDNGMTSSCRVVHADREYHYYTGWNLGVTVPFYLAIGVARTGADGAWQRVTEAPALGRSAADPLLTASPWVRVESERWRMWYVSGSRWTTDGGRPRHYYHVRYAESADGLRWQADGRVCIDYASPDEHAISRPCVLQDGHGYHMWYAHRGTAYRIGYAVSADGLRWERRDDEAGIDVSATGWDSEMIEYPCVFDYRGQRYLLYNGNGFGETGIGLAIRDR